MARGLEVRECRIAGWVRRDRRASSARPRAGTWAPGSATAPVLLLLRPRRARAARTVAARLRPTPVEVPRPLRESERPRPARRGIRPDRGLSVQANLVASSGGGGPLVARLVVILGLVRAIRGLGKGQLLGPVLGVPAVACTAKRCLVFVGSPTTRVVKSSQRRTTTRVRQIDRPRHGTPVGESVVVHPRQYGGPVADDGCQRHRARTTLAASSTPRAVVAVNGTMIARSFVIIGKLLL